MSDNFKSALSQLALAMVPHLAEELINAVTVHFANTAPTVTSDASKTTQQLAAEDAAREDAAAAAAATAAATAAEPKKTGRRSRGAANPEPTPEPTPEPETAPAPTGRKRRSTAATETKTEEKPKLIADDTEQAAIRAQLIVDLGDLADVEEAHQRVHQYLAEASANTINDVPSAHLYALAEKVGALIDEFFGEE